MKNKGTIIDIKTKNINSYKHIYSLNDFKIPPHNRLFKYMLFEIFVKSVKEKELVFVSPKKWKDPFECRFYETDYSSLGYKRPEIACMCMTYNSTKNEEASWKLYANPNNKTLKITIDFTELCGILDDYAEKNNSEVYIGKAIYLFTKKDIQSLQISKDKNHDTFFPKKGFSIEHYLTLMLLKRVSFTFEDEVRIFIVRKNNLYIDRTELLKIPDVDDTKSLIPNITLAPYEPLPKDDIMAPLKKKVNSTESIEYKKVINELLNYSKSNCVCQSQLYSSLNPLKKI